MIKIISSQEVLPLRSLVLRNGQPFEACVFEGDNGENVFHLGCFINDELISVVSFMPSNIFENLGNGYQLRGMATHPYFEGKGSGKALINFAISYLKNKSINYIWCNARALAVPFYEKQGFVKTSEEFQIEGIGPHYQMKLDLGANVQL